MNTLFDRKVEEMQELFPDLDESECKDLVASGARPKQIKEFRENEQPGTPLQIIGKQAGKSVRTLKVKIRDAWRQVQEFEREYGRKGEGQENPRFTIVPVGVRTPDGVEKNLLIYFNWRIPDSSRRVEVVVEDAAIADEMMILSRKPRENMNPQSLDLPEAYPESRIQNLPDNALSKSRWMNLRETVKME